MIDYSKFRSSLKGLEEQHQHYRQDIALFPDWIHEGMAESVIQRFETCYDCLWKVLKRYLIENLGIPEPPNSPKPILRMANENMLLDSPLNRWFCYADARTGTAHDYSESKAQACLTLVPGFINDSIALYEVMTGESWK